MSERPYSRDVIPPIMIDSAFGWVIEDREMSPEESARLVGDINLLNQVREYMMATYAHGSVPAYHAKFEHLEKLERQARQALAQ